MTKAFIPAVLAALLVAAPATAQQTTPANTTGTFTSVSAEPVDPGSTYQPTYSGLGTATLTYGVGDPVRVSFQGAQSTYAPPAPFLLGTLTFYNGATFAGSQIAAANLKFITTLADPINPSGDGLGTLNEMIYFNNTPNTSDPEASADFISFASLSDGAFVFEGQSATFNLFGSINSPLTLSSISLASGSGFVAAAPPFTGDISQIAAVPEPSTWAMMLLGFFGIGGVVRSGRRQTVEAVLA